MEFSDDIGKLQRLMAATLHCILTMVIASYVTYPMRS